MERTHVGHLFLIIAGILAIVIIFTLLYSNITKTQKLSKLQSEVDDINKRYLSQSGGTLVGDKFINYHLRSFDSGKTWYACEWKENWDFTILGEVETVYPGLLGQIEGWRVLSEYVEKNGPINPNKITPEIDSAFKAVNLKIVKKNEN